MEDERIVALFFERDERAIGETDAKYRRLCLKISENILKSRRDAEECVADSLMALWKTIPPNKPENLCAYLCQIVRNNSLTRLDYLLAEKRSAGAEVPLSEFEEFLPDCASRGAFGEIELEDLFNRFLAALKPETRKIFIRRYFFFDTVQSIAADFNISESKVKSLLMRTRKKLKDYLSEREYDL